MRAQRWDQLVYIARAANQSFDVLLAKTVVDLEEIQEAVNRLLAREAAAVKA